MIRESRVTESAQEIVDSFPCIADIRHMSTICQDLFALGVEVCFTRIREISAENTKYAQHYISYGYSFRIYGNFAEILK